MLTEAFDHEGRRHSRHSHTGDGKSTAPVHQHHLRSSRETGNSPRHGNTNSNQLAQPELPGSASGHTNISADQLRHLQRLESAQRHTLHVVKSGAWQARATELAMEGEGECYSSQVSNAGDQ